MTSPGALPDDLTLSVVIMAYNEEDSLPLQLEQPAWREARVYT